MDGAVSPGSGTVEGDALLDGVELSEGEVSGVVDSSLLPSGLVPGSLSLGESHGEVVPSSKPDELLSNMRGPSAAPLSFTVEVFLCVNEPPLVLTGTVKDIIRSLPLLIPCTVTMTSPFLLLELV